MGQQDSLPYTEQTPLVACHPYDVSKSCTDMLAKTYGVTYQLPVIITRCGNVYGGGDVHWDRLIPGTIRSLHRGERPIVRSDGTFTRDYVYIEDAVSAYLAAAEAADRPDLAGAAFNFGPESPQSALVMIELLQRLMNRTDLEPVILNEARGEIRDQYLSSVLAQKVLGWEPHHPLEAGLRKTIPWYETYLKSQNMDVSHAT